MSVRSHISKNTYKLYEIFCILLVAVAPVASDDNAVCYVFPVLWMTSCLPVRGHAEIARFRRSLMSFARGRQQCTRSL